MNYLLVVFFMINGELVSDNRFQPIEMESKEKCEAAMDGADQLFSGNPPYVLACVEYEK